MKPSLPFFRTFLFVLAVLFLGQSTAQAQSGQDILDRLRTRYERIDALRADFRQTTVADYLDGDEHYNGVITLRGDQYRVETTAQTIVTNGKVTWIHNVGENQVLINDHVEDETTFSLNDFLFNFDDGYEIVSVGRALIGGKDHHMLRLRPRQSAAYFRELTVVVRDADDLIARLEVVDVNETKLIFELRNIEIDPPVDAATFSFTPPHGTEVIDLRS